MNIKETIGIYPGTLSDEFCDRLIEIFHEKKDLQYKGEMASGVDPTVKDTTEGKIGLNSGKIALNRAK